GVHRVYRMIALSDAIAAMPYPVMGFGEVSAVEVQRIALTALANEFCEVTNNVDLMHRIHNAMQHKRLTYDTPNADSG
ncbi:hypothetical protein Q8W27_17380, partial [Oceanobacter sp. 2_MG-2023]|nr:hypothetical protein [Oceanobacter sp. 2_MG-2023]